MKDLVKAYRAYWKNAFNFYNRTSLGGYWRVVLLNAIIGIALLVYMYLSTSGAISGFVNPLASLGPVAPIIILVLWPFVNVVPSLALTFRRLHDIGKGGAYYLFAFIPLVGIFIMIVFMTTPTAVPYENRFGYRRQV
jgi:uncharacterized membrane protein YhaH (DUF805 family)